MSDKFKVPSFVFGTKAATLEYLKRKLSHSKIPSFEVLSEQEWRTNRQIVLERLAHRFKGRKVAVRSSAMTEDAAEATSAGKYTSELNVAIDVESELEDAIKKVFSSYKDGTCESNDNNSVIVQEFVSPVILSGVVFTQDLNTGAPYYVVNYDDASGKTDTVTSGTVLPRSLYIHRGSTDMLHSERWRKILNVIQEIEQITGSNQLDIEFAIDEHYYVWVFQVRQITLQLNWNRSLTLRVEQAITHIQGFISRQLQPLPGIFGDQSVFGQMPDWNPAEIIGTAPRALAVSLYRYLITDTVWRIARKQMGYAEPTGCPLMVTLGGQPFIDVRLSFHSFVPAKLDPRLGDRLVTAWLSRLRDNPELHDKVEFDVAITVLSFDFEQRFAAQCSEAGFTDLEQYAYRSNLHGVTAALLEQRVAPISIQLGKIAELEKIRTDMSRDGRFPDIITIRALLETCLELGTIPYAILARHAFIASTFLRSLSSKGILTSEKIAAFHESVETVATEFVRDSSLLKEGRLAIEKFMELYGHLRPGTYEIRSDRYDNRWDFFHPQQSSDGEPHTASKPPTFILSPTQNQAIDDLLGKYGYNIQSSQLFDYIASAIKAREYGKFMFTRCVSDVLELIAVWGQRLGLSRDELSHIPINTILDTGTITDGRNLEEHLRHVSRKFEQDHQITQALKLPMIVWEPNDIHVVPLHICHPNFVTKKVVEASVVEITVSTPSQHIEGALVVTECADPGFDWILTCGIVGLMTKFGGANSHMAIRCAELGIPAAIGCGPQIYELIRNSERILLDCESERIVPIIAKGA